MVQSPVNGSNSILIYTDKTPTPGWSEPGLCFHGQCCNPIGVAYVSKVQSSWLCRAHQNSMSCPKIVAPDEALSTVWWIDHTAHAALVRKSMMSLLLIVLAKSISVVWSIPMIIWGTRSSTAFAWGFLTLVSLCWSHIYGGPHWGTVPVLALDENVIPIPALSDFLPIGA